MFSTNQIDFGKGLNWDAYLQKRVPQPVDSSSTWNPRSSLDLNSPVRAFTAQKHPLEKLDLLIRDPQATSRPETRKAELLSAITALESDFPGITEEVKFEYWRVNNKPPGDRDWSANHITDKLYQYAKLILQYSPISKT